MSAIRIIPFLILFSLAACKPSDQSGTGSTLQFVPPLIVRTELADTLPAKAIQKLKLKNVQGIKIKYPTGQHVSYFDYNADRNTVLDAISTLPFSKYSPLADTTCRKVSVEAIEQMKSMITEEERESGSLFWQASFDEFELYECLKAPFRHTLLIGKKTNRIIHRIEYIG